MLIPILVHPVDIPYYPPGVEDTAVAVRGVITVRAVGQSVIRSEHLQECIIA